MGLIEDSGRGRSTSTPGQPGTGTGGISGSLLIRQGDDDGLGLYVLKSGADPSWHFRAVEGAAEVAATAATLVYESSGSRSLSLVFAAAGDAPRQRFRVVPDGDFLDPSQVNGFAITHAEHPAPVAGATASAAYGDLRISSAHVNSADGNDDTYSVEAGTPVEPAVNAEAEVDAANNAVLNVRSPDVTAGDGTHTNTGGVRVTTGPANDPPVLAKAVIPLLDGSNSFAERANGIEVTHPVAGADGNDYTVRMVRGTYGGALNALAGAAGSGIGPLNIRSPAIKAASAELNWSGSHAITISHTAAGDEGNEFKVSVQHDSVGLTANTATAAYVADDILLIRVHGVVNNGRIIDAVNAARYTGGGGSEQLVEAALASGGGGRTSGALINSQADLADDSAILTGGGAAGETTNTGEFRVVTGTLRTDPEGASVDVNIAGDGDTEVIIRITLTGDSRGAAGNDIDVEVFHDPNIGDTEIYGRASADDSTIQISINGTASIAALLTELDRAGGLLRSNGETSGITATASIVQNAGNALSVTWAAADVDRTYDMSGGLDGSAAASVTVNVAPSGDTAVNLLFTMDTAGADQNGISLGFSSLNRVDSVAVDWDAMNRQFGVHANGTYTLTELIAALNGAQSAVPADVRFTVSLPPGADGSTSVTWEGTDSPGTGASGNFSGGSDGTPDPLTAAWDADAHRLTVTARSNHSFSEVRAAIAALDEFRIGSSTDNEGPGIVWYGTGAGGNNTITVSATDGGVLDYAFAGADNDGIARSNLRTTWSVPNRRLVITGILLTDTAQDIVDAVVTRNELQAGDGSSAGDVRLLTGADASDAPVLGPNSGDRLHYDFAGGADGTAFTLTAAYDASTNRLTVTALSTHTVAQAIAAIIALSEFQQGADADVANAGDVFSADTGEDMVVGDDEGDSIDYAFAGGTDEVPRSTLAAASADNAGGGQELSVTGILAADTTQDVIDAYAGSDFTLSSVGGDASATLPGTAASGSLSGGVTTVPRLAPTVELSSHDDDAGTAEYAVVYHGPATPQGQRTTLAELLGAWESVGGGGASPVGAVSSGGGSTRVTTAPSSPSGGVDYVPPDPVRLRSLPDSSLGPHVEARFRSDIHALRDILDAEPDDAGITVVEYYQTDLASAPEDPPYQRALFQLSGDGDGSGGLSQDEVDARIETGVQDWAEEGNTEIVNKLVQGAQDLGYSARYTLATYIAANYNGNAIPGGSLGFNADDLEDVTELKIHIYNDGRDDILPSLLTAGARITIGDHGGGDRAIVLISGPAVHLGGFIHSAPVSGILRPTGTDVRLSPIAYPIHIHGDWVPEIREYLRDEVPYWAFRESDDPLPSDKVFLLDGQDAGGPVVASFEPGTAGSLADMEWSNSGLLQMRADGDLGDRLFALAPTTMTALLLNDEEHTFSFNRLTPGDPGLLSIFLDSGTPFTETEGTLEIRAISSIVTEDSVPGTAVVQAWQDGSDTGTSAPADAQEFEAYIGNALAPVTFAAMAAPRVLHIAVPLAYELDLIFMGGLDQSGEFTAETSATHRVYHSARLSDTDALTALLRLVEG